MATEGPRRSMAPGRLLFSDLSFSIVAVRLTKPSLGPK